MSEQEIEWRPVKDFPNYDVSNTGLVQSKKRNKLIYQHNNHGYWVVNLYQDGVRYPRKVHRLVALAFLARTGGRNHVNHIDGNGLNNHTSNLEWVTAKENHIHAREILNHGHHGEKSNLAKLKLAQVIEIREKYFAGSTYEQLGAEYNVLPTTIRDLITGKTWRMSLNEQI